MNEWMNNIKKDLLRLKVAKWEINQYKKIESYLWGRENCEKTCRRREKESIYIKTPKEQS